MMRRLALATACALALAGCASTLDLGKAGRAMRGNPPPPAPQLVESSAAEPPAPAGVRATQSELREIAVRWDPVLAGSVGGYVLERGLAEAGPFQRVAVLTDRFETGHLDRGFDLAPKASAAGGEPGLGDGTTYFYRVRAYDDDGRISAAGSAIATGRTAPPPAPPEGVRVLSRLPRKVALGWQPSEDPTVEGYVVMRSPGTQGPFEPIAELDGRHRTHYVDRGLGDLHVFYYQVAAVNAAGARGAPSAPALALTKPDPLPPAGVALSAEGGERVLSWQPNVEPDVVAYRVVRRVEGEDEPEVVGTVQAPDTRLAVGAAPETVSYEVIAVDADGLESQPARVPVGPGAVAAPPSGRAAGPREGSAEAPATP